MMLANVAIRSLRKVVPQGGSAFPVVQNYSDDFSHSGNFILFVFSAVNLNDLTRRILLKVSKD